MGNRDIAYIGYVPPLHKGGHVWARQGTDTVCVECEKVLHPPVGAFKLQVGTTAIAIADGAHPRRAKRIMQLCMAILEAEHYDFDSETVRAQWGGRR